MPLDFKILEQFGTTDERLREILTAQPAPKDASDDVKARKKQDCEVRRRFEERFTARTQEAIEESLRSYHLTAASDLAWDATPITKATVPLMLYAQNRISNEACAKLLEDAGCDRYVKRDASGKILDVERPRFVAVEVNLVRSIVTRRVAAQMSRFLNLWPLFKYEPRSTRQEAKLRGDAVSQRVDIQASQYGYRPLHEQICRDLLLYSRALIFPRCKWERDVEFYRKDVSEAFSVEGKTNIGTRVVREGVTFKLVHPNRAFCDGAYHFSSINSDTGCTWFGYWDVARYNTIKDEPLFFNRDAVGYNNTNSQFLGSNRAYFAQYFSTSLSPGRLVNGPETQNDAKANVALYAGLREDAPCFLTHINEKLVPAEHGVGTYPYPVWVHFTVAGDTGTVIHAEIMPDTPGVYFGFNESHHRIQNMSMAADLFGHQDTMNNLTNLLLQEVQRDLFAVFALNTDIWDHTEQAKAAKEEFIRALSSGQYDKPLMVCGSFQKIRALLGDNAVTADNILKVIRTTPNTAIENIFKSMGQVMQLAERMLALSPQEQGQMSPRETSATDVLNVATTTENVYSFISDAIDEGRAAWKRYLHNALISCATENIDVPVIGRYAPDVARRAGFELTADEAGSIDAPPGRRFFGSVTGSKWHLVEEYVFNTRDGAERSSNIQAANSLTQLLQVILSTPAAGTIKKAKFAEILNEIARLGGSGVDLNLDFGQAEGEEPIAPPAPPQGVPAGAPPV